MTHPLRLDAQDVMTTDLGCVFPSTTIRDLARTFEEHAISGAPVVNSDGSLVGIVSKTDLIRRCTEAVGDMPPAYLFEVLFEQCNDSNSLNVFPEPLVCVKDFMTEKPVVISRSTPATAVAELMFTRRIHRVIVIDGKNMPVGIITCLDLLGVLPRMASTSAQPRSSTDGFTLGSQGSSPFETKSA